jgi:hypothetical protein
MRPVTSGNKTNDGRASTKKKIAILTILLLLLLLKQVGLLSLIGMLYLGLLHLGLGLCQLIFIPSLH